MDAAPTAETPLDITTRLHQVNVERVVTFLNCLERITFACAGESCKGAVSAAVRNYRLGACGGVGCLRRKCHMAQQHRNGYAEGNQVVLRMFAKERGIRNMLQPPITHIILCHTECERTRAIASRVTICTQADDEDPG